MTANQYDFLENLLSASPEYFDLYQKLKNWANSVWADHMDVHEQIRHDGSHSNRMREFACAIFKAQIDKDFFTDREIFLLLSSFFLHDIGMQTGWKNYLGINSTRGNLSSDERASIRKEHAGISGYVIRSFKNKLPKSLEDILSERQKTILTKDLNESLAFICESHNQANIERYLAVEIPTRFPETTLKIDLLAGTVQLCDTLHMDKGRLNEERFIDAIGNFLNDETDELGYTEHDWKRYFQCYYIEEVRVAPASNTLKIPKIEICYRFHKDERMDVKDRLLEIYKSRLEKQRHDCLSVLNNHDIHFVSDYMFTAEDPDSTKALFPDKLDRILGAKEVLEHKLHLHAGTTLKLPPHFLGRAYDVSSIADLITSCDGKITTLLGPPGVGKSELAKAVALHTRETFKDEPLFLELEGVNSLDTLLLAVKTAFNLSGGASSDILFKAVEEHAGLIIYDNFEDPLQDKTNVIKFIERFLNCLQKGTLMVTTREPLDVPRIEKVFNVKPLDRDDARHLLINLIKNTGIHKMPDETDIEMLLTQLDNVPLAIELAAPYVKYGIKEMIDALYTLEIDILKIPGIETENADKNQSWITSLNLSYTAIKNSDSDILFKLLSFFPAGLEKNDIFHLAPDITVHALRALESKSLIIRSEDIKYSMLAPIRLYSEYVYKNQEDRQELDTLLIRFWKKRSLRFNACTRGASDISPQRLNDDLPNWFKFMGTVLSEEIYDEEIFTILANTTDYLRFQGIHTEIKHLLQQAKNLAAKNNDAQNEANCIKSIGGIHFIESENDAAKSAFEKAIPMYQKVGDLLGEANCIQSIGDIHFIESENDAAKSAFEKAIPMYQKVGSLLGEANCIQSIGVLKLKEKKITNGISLLLKADKMYTIINDKYSRRRNFMILGKELKTITGYEEKGKEFIEKAEKIFSDIA